ncbi:uncharacterized protein LOC114239880 isoform X1 [Bombyx mandarina]|uniref:Uncharacterized protein LOC114239880 isoform X1 n=1 Tax=Bombyx mandarina TaxID=7092 RepID=A0A6J2J9X7_BOMMA|nr:uncharacterized protein LOC114239880 isoform X1 [Bombyx mandarina]
MASDEQFSLCWNNFHANMSAGFHGLLSRGDLVDVTLAAEGRLLQAHKLVLSVCSPYFQEMFKMNPTQHPIVFLKDVSHSALRDLLQFMYQGEVNVKQEELASFISTAEQLQVKGLTGNQNEESSTPSKPKPTSRPGPRSSQQRQSVMTKLETDLDSKPSSTPVAVKRPNRPSIASNNSSSSQSGPAKRKCVDPLEAGPSGSAKDEFVTIPDEDENNAVAPKMEPEFVNESMWDDDEDGTNNDETNYGEDDSNMEMTGFDGSATGDVNISGGEGGAVGDAQETEAPAWTSVYFAKLADDEGMKCSLCEEVLRVDEKSLELLNHMTIVHNDIYNLHKDNPEANIEFRIEFIEVNMSNDDVDPKTHSIVIEDVCEVNKTAKEIQHVNTEDHVICEEKKKEKNETSKPRKRSWIWKYFEKLGNIKYRCNICKVVLSVKGTSTTNLKRHVRTRHPHVYIRELSKIKSSTDSELRLDTDTASHLQNRGINANDHRVDGLNEVSLVDNMEKKKFKYNVNQSKASGNRLRRSWVWSYFKIVSPTHARCKLCGRLINHGRYSSGNLNRHLNVVHKKKTQPPETRSKGLRRSWIWCYFSRVTSSQAQCKLCSRHISHAGNASGNMNRHLRRIHNKTAEYYETEKILETQWIWKVIDRCDDGGYSCKICEFRSENGSEEISNLTSMLAHLKAEHGIVSGDQIITEGEQDED